MMKVEIKETGKQETLELQGINGTDWVIDFIGNWGALDDGQFTYDRDRGVYVTSEETFNWWAEAIAREQQNHDRIEELAEQYGRSKVDSIIGGAAYGLNDLEDVQKAISAALDEAFGE